MIDRVLFALGFVYFLAIPFTNASFLGAIGLGLVARGIWHLIVRRQRAQIATHVTIAQRGSSPRRERQRSMVAGTMHTVPKPPRSAPSPGMHDAVPPQRAPSAAMDFDAVEALRGLGFRKATAIALLLASASSDLSSTEQRVIAALRATAVPSVQPEARRS